MTIEQLNALSASVKMLAATPAEQEAYLDGLGVSPSADELALELDDAMAGIVLNFAEARSALAALNEQLNRMSGEKRSNLWTTAALHEAPEWRTVRKLAREAFAALEK